MTPEVAASMVVGPDDHLVLISKAGLSQAQLREIVARVTAALHGRVLVVDGTTLDAKVIRGAAQPEQTDHSPQAGVIL